MQYDNTPTVVVVLATNDQGELITIRRNNEPGRGLLGLPGGYHMRGESWQDAGAREFMEETGLWGDPESLRQVGQTVTDEYGNNLIVAHTKLPATKAAWEIDPEEVQEVVLLLESPEPSAVAFPKHWRAMEDFFERRREMSV